MWVKVHGEQLLSQLHRHSWRCSPRYQVRRRWRAQCPRAARGDDPGGHLPNGRVHPRPGGGNHRRRSSPDSAPLRWWRLDQQRSLPHACLVTSTATAWLTSWVLAVAGAAVCALATGGGNFRGASSDFARVWRYHPAGGGWTSNDLYPRVLGDPSAAMGWLMLLVSGAPEPADRPRNGRRQFWAHHVLWPDLASPARWRGGPRMMISILARLPT